MKFLMCYLFSGLKKTARNSQNAIKESPPKASQTQKIVFRRRFAPQNPPQGWMDELGFYVPSTVFQSFRDDGRVNMKGSVQ